MDTDRIIPARYLTRHDPAFLAKHCMEDEDPTFADRVRPGDLIIAGDNFGCGSSREHAPIAIKAVGVAGVIAPTFARIFFRNAINTGLPILECPEVMEGVRTGDQLEVDFGAGTIRNLTSGAQYQARPLPPFVLEIVAAGGLIDHVRQKREEAS
ncbi:MAG: 3-isopropylmalate dehydratase small subunit [Firmicutes bacterium]|nr:3-isopropylmalate dehydratase small subunit [Bacillota bacterium]